MRAIVVPVHLARARASVRLRVTVAVVLLVALVLGVGAALLLRSVERSVRDQVEEGNREALGHVHGGAAG